jgi:hypothetical protein
MAELNSHDEYRGSGGGEQVPEGVKHGPKYWLDIEGELKPWDRDTITTEEVIQLGGWDPSQGAIIIDKDNNERTLQPGEVIEIKPGMGFAKKVRFRRG